MFAWKNIWLKKKSSFDYRPCCSDHDYCIVLGELYCEAKVLKPGHGRKGVTLKGAAAILECLLCGRHGSQCSLPV